MICMGKGKVTDTALKNWFDSRKSWTDKLYHEGLYGPYVFKYWKRYLQPYYDLFSKNNVIDSPNIIDVGIGTGHLLVTWGKYFYPNAKLYGLDISPEMLDSARKKLKENGLTATLKEGVADKNPYKSNYFDLVFSHDVIHHVLKQRQPKALSELVRIAKVGGFISLRIPDSKGFRKSKKSTEIIIPKGDKVIYETTFTKEDLKELLKVVSNETEIIQFAAAESYGYRRITDIVRSFNYRFNLPKLFIYWVTVLQMKLISLGVFPSFCRGYKVILKKVK